MSDLSNGDRWKLLLIVAALSTLSGLGGGAGWRAIDPTKFTAADARLQEQRFTKLEEAVKGHEAIAKSVRAIDGKVDAVLNVLTEHRLDHPDVKLNERILWLEWKLGKPQPEVDGG